MGARNQRRSAGKVEAVLLVAVVLLMGYLVGAAASGAVRAWWEGMPV